MKTTVKLTKNEFFVEIPNEILEELEWTFKTELKVETVDICEDDGESKGIVISKIE